MALDGSPSGLSHDELSLVLIEPRVRFPRRVTRFAQFDPATLRRLARITLRGDFSFDALSPDGRLMYLIEYTSRRDPTRYSVRAYDLKSRRLLPEEIIDPDEEPGEMSGYALSRATSRDGRWAYTLYDGAGGEPFIHALDTVGRTAVCIDMPVLEGRPDLHLLRLTTGSGLRVTKLGKPIAAVNPRTFAVTSPVPRAAAAAPEASEGDAGIAAEWAVGGGLLLAFAGFSARRRGRRA